MVETKLNADETCARFSKIYWHDSKLINLHILKRPEEGQYDLQLDLNLIVSFSPGNTEWRKHSAIFRDCRIVQTDLDLLGVLLCGGDIGVAGCYPDSLELEKRKRDKVRLFDLPQDLNPLSKCIGFFFEMIPPGGQLIIFARDFTLI